MSRKRKLAILYFILLIVIYLGMYVIRYIKSQKQPESEELTDLTNDPDFASFGSEVEEGLDTNHPFYETSIPDFEDFMYVTKSDTEKLMYYQRYGTVAELQLEDDKTGFIKGYAYSEQISGEKAAKTILAAIVEGRSRYVTDGTISRGKLDGNIPYQYCSVTDRKNRSYMLYIAPVTVEKKDIVISVYVPESEVETYELTREELLACTDRVIFKDILTTELAKDGIIPVISGQ